MTDDERFVVDCLIRLGHSKLWAMQLVKNASDSHMREEARKIIEDMERQGSGGQYDMGMKRALFLIDPDK